MANKKFTDYTSKTTAATNDVLLIVDTSSNTTKQLAVSGLTAALASTLPAAQPSWVGPTLLNSWTNYDTSQFQAAGYMKDSLGFVHLRGMVKTGTSGSVIFNVPTGYRPTKNNVYLLNCGDAAGAGRVNVSGDVQHINGSTTFVSLDGIIYKAEA